MAVRIRIAVKIFGLAVSLLALTVALSIFGIVQTRHLRLELKGVAEGDLPLEDLVQETDSAALIRQVAFERWLGLMRTPHPDARALAETVDLYQKQSQAVDDHARKLLEMLNQMAASGGPDGDLAGIRQSLGEVQRSYRLMSNVQMVILGRLKAGNTGDLVELMSIQDSIQHNLRSLRQAMTQNIHNLTGRAARAAEARDQEVLEVTSITTTLAIAFGLAFAWLMTRRMVQPVEMLMTGMRSVEGGDLNTKLLVQTTDEIGALTVSFNNLVGELRSKAQLKETFGKYVDRRIVESVILNPSLAETEGGKREMTVSFCDLVGFTGIGEDLAPATLVRLLNRHFGLMSEAIHESQGVVDKFIGDAVMAFWGPPFVKAAEHAILACRSALAQLEALGRFRAEVPDLTGLRKHVPLIDLRIGIASGDVVVGNIGSENARSYTVIGDTVNLASRLEGVNRVYGTRILINSETRRLAGEAIETREIDWIAVKGKTEPATVYELLGAAGETPSNSLAMRDKYEEGLAAYRRRDFSAACHALLEALEVAPEDGPSKLLLTRIQQMQEESPGADWDGVWHLAEK